MKKLFTLFLFLSTALLSSLSMIALSATYYVNPFIGNDANGGSSAAPFKTIGKASSKAVKGDTIALQPGVFSHASGERFPIFVNNGVKITAAQSPYIVPGVMQSTISGEKPDGTRYTQAFEVWGNDLTVEKVAFSKFTRPFHVESSGVLRLNIVAFYDNLNGAFQAINGGKVVINDITIGRNTGGFYVGTGAEVSANTIYVHDSAKSGIEVNGHSAHLSATNLRLSGAPNFTLLKVRDGGHASLHDMRIHGTGSCVAPCSEESAITVYEDSSLYLKGGELKWNRPGPALYSEVDTDMDFVDSLFTAAVLIERTFADDNTHNGLISIGGTFGSAPHPPENYSNLPLLKIKHPDGVGLELRNANAKTEGFMDVEFDTRDGISILLGKNAYFSGDDLRFGNSKGTHFLVSGHTHKSQAPRIESTTFSNNATMVVDMRNCSKNSARAEFRNNTWKKNSQGSSATGHYPPGEYTGPIFGPNVSIASNCKIRV